MTTTRPPATRPSRRTLVKGAAWATPVIAMAAPVHAQTLSPGSCGYTQTTVASVCYETRWQFIFQQARYRVCFTNGCPADSQWVTVSSVSVNGRSVPGSATVQPGSNACLESGWFDVGWVFDPWDPPPAVPINFTRAVDGDPETVDLLSVPLVACSGIDSAQPPLVEGQEFDLEDGRTLTVRGGELVDESGRVIRSEKDLLAPAPEVTSVEPKATAPVETTTETPAPVEPAAPTTPPAPEPPAETPAPQPVVDQSTQTATPTSDN